MNTLFPFSLRPFLFFPLSLFFHLLPSITSSSFSLSVSYSLHNTPSSFPSPSLPPFSSFSFSLSFSSLLSLFLLFWIFLSILFFHMMILHFLSFFPSSSTLSLLLASSPLSLFFFPPLQLSLVNSFILPFYSSSLFSSFLPLFFLSLSSFPPLFFLSLFSFPPLPLSPLLLPSSSTLISSSSFILPFSLPPRSVLTKRPGPPLNRTAPPHLISASPVAYPDEVLAIEYFDYDVLEAVMWETLLSPPPPPSISPASARLHSITPSHLPSFSPPTPLHPHPPSPTRSCYPPTTSQFVLTQPESPPTSSPQHPSLSLPPTTPSLPTLYPLLKISLLSNVPLPTRLTPKLFFPTLPDPPTTHHPLSLVPPSQTSLLFHPLLTTPHPPTPSYPPLTYHVHPPPPTFSYPPPPLPPSLTPTPQLPQPTSPPSHTPSTSQLVLFPTSTFPPLYPNHLLPHPSNNSSTSPLVFQQKSLHPTTFTHTPLHYPLYPTLNEVLECTASLNS
ncbi:hypothetical protein C7M84_011396 [Penaeus vannamei]|uniref:Uncharacterized protein n=1 Tax=Penaeus vannamei TaxID=6689 RepID=A0A423T1I3_PENVA|nr:hypothetical protein C7M84_011396 [Penaeus vannamei]